MNSRYPRGLLAVAAAIACASAWAPLVTAQAPARSATAPLVIKGGTILTVTKGTIPNGMVIVRDGKIAAVGANLDVPAGAEVVDATTSHGDLLALKRHLAANAIPVRCWWGQV